jgi:hypothetical protein
VTLPEALRALEAKARALPNQARRGLGWSGARLLDSARAHSEGPYSSAALAAMGHPYSRRHPAAPLDPAVINVQTGQFRSSWAWRLPQESGGKLTTVVRNDDPKADDLASGTNRMIPRPLPEKVLAENESAIIAEMERAMERALKEGPH